MESATQVLSGSLVTAAYIIAAVLFIFSLAGLSKHETAKSGNVFGITGMTIALLATIANQHSSALVWILVAMAVGAVIGIYLARKVELTQMP